MKLELSYAYCLPTKWTNGRNKKIANDPTFLKLGRPNFGWVQCILASMIAEPNSS